MSNLRQLTKLNSINGTKTEKNKRLTDVETPQTDRDAVNKKWIVDNYVHI